MTLWNVFALLQRRTEGMTDEQSAAFLQAVADIVGALRLQDEPLPEGWKAIEPSEGKAA